MPGTLSPSLPTDATTMMPFFQATSAAQDSGSADGLCGLALP